MAITESTVGIAPQISCCTVKGIQATAWAESEGSEGALSPRAKAFWGDSYSSF
jgi:hypothetical protein